MAILSPALVVAMCVMFIFTRLHRHYYIFERPFLFGLKFCLEPDQQQVQAIVEATNKKNPSSQSQPSKKQGKQSASNSSKSKVNVNSLSIRRSKLGETYFTVDSEFPHHRQFDHIMALVCGYIASFLFEEGASLLFPSTLANRRAIYVAIFTVIFATVESWSISVGLVSKKIMWGSTIVATVVTLAIITAGDFPTFFHFDTAFTALRSATSSTLIDSLQLDEDQAGQIAKHLTLSMQIIISILAGFMASAMFVPVRRFSRLDYDMHLQYRQDQYEAEQDPYHLGRPKPITMFTIALDYLLPLLTVTLWVSTPRYSPSYPSWLLLCVLACVVTRFALLRLRMQAYLDSAISAYRRFWVDKTIVGAAEAARLTTFQVIGNSFYLIMLLVAYIAPPICTLLFGMIAKLDGAVPFGLFAKEVSTAPFDIFCREIAGFLAWWTLAVYVGLGLISLLTEFTLDILDPQARDRNAKLPTSTATSSETRRQRRMMQRGKA